MATKETSRGEDLACGKCEKAFRFQAWRDRHEKKCKGPRAAPAPRARNAAEPDEEPTSEASSSSAVTSEPLVVVDRGAGQLSIKERILNMLEMEEEQLTKRLGDVKKLIVAVRQVEVGGDD